MADNDFLKFSCGVYMQVKDICLRLQDEAGLDINMLLFCCWLGKCGYHVKNPAELMAITQQWNGYIMPLRDIRRRIKELDSELYQSTKKLELHYEFACQRALEKYAVAHLMTDKGSGGGGSIHDNLQIYLRFHSEGKIASWINQAVCAIGDIAKDYKET